MAPERLQSRSEEQPNQKIIEQTPLANEDFENLCQGKERLEELDERLREKDIAEELTQKEIIKLKKERDELAKSVEMKRVMIEGALSDEKEKREKAA